MADRYARALILTLAIAAAATPIAGAARDSNPPAADAARIEGSDDGAPGREFARSSDGLFYVHAMVNGQRVRFLVDTGASVIMLTPADAARIGVAPGRFTAEVETASGRAPMAWTTIDQVELAGREIHDVRAAVMRQGLGVSLLGQDMLSRLGSVTIEGDAMRMR